LVHFSGILLKATRTAQMALNYQRPEVQTMLCSILSIAYFVLRDVKTVEKL